MCKQVGRELNVRYVLEGSVQRGGNRLRVNVQLIDAETGNHLWAERFDKPVADLFDMQDEIVSRLANTLDAQLIAAEARRAERSPHPDAMDLYFQGRACLNKGMTPEYMAQARGFFERALALDPGNIEALVGTALVDFNSGATFSTDDRTAHLAAAETALIKALSHGPTARAGPHVSGRRPYFHEPRGPRHCRMRAGVGAGSKFGRRAWLDRSRQDFIWSRRGDRGPYPRGAPPLSSRYLRLPVDAVCRSRQVLLGADAEAVAWLRRSIEANRNFPFAHFFLAAALAPLGALDEARAAVQAGLALDPGFTLRRYRAGASSDNPTLPRRTRARL